MGKRISDSISNGTDGTDRQDLFTAFAVGIVVFAVVMLIGVLFGNPRGTHLLGLQYTNVMQFRTAITILITIVILILLSFTVPRGHQGVRKTRRGTALHEGRIVPHLNSNLAATAIIDKGPYRFDINSGSVWTADVGCVRILARATVCFRDVRTLGETPEQRQQTFSQLCAEIKRSVKEFGMQATTTQVVGAAGANLCIPGFELDKRYQEYLKADVQIVLGQANVLSTPQKTTPVVQDPTFRAFMEALTSQVTVSDEDEVPVVDLTGVVPIRTFPVVAVVHQSNVVEAPVVTVLTGEDAVAVIGSIHGELHGNVELEAKVDLVPVVNVRQDSVLIGTGDDATVPGGLPELEPMQLSLAAEDVQIEVTPLARLAAAATGLSVAITAKALNAMKAVPGDGVTEVPQELNLSGINPANLMPHASDGLITAWNSVHDSRPTIRLSIDDEHQRAPLALVAPVPGARKYPLTWRLYEDACQMSIARLDQLETLLTEIQACIARHRGDNARIVDEVLSGDQTKDDSPAVIAGGEDKLLRCTAALVFSWKAARWTQNRNAGQAVGRAEYPTVPDSLSILTEYTAPTVRTVELGQFRGPVDYTVFANHHSARTVTLPGQFLEFVTGNTAHQQLNADSLPKAVNG
jgi:hypothetical protein